MDFGRRAQGCIRISIISQHKEYAARDVTLDADRLVKKGYRASSFGEPLSYPLFLLAGRKSPHTAHIKDWEVTLHLRGSEELIN